MEKKIQDARRILQQDRYYPARKKIKQKKMRLPLLY